MSVTSKLKHEMCLAVGIKKRSRWNKAEEQHGFELVEQYLSERRTSIRQASQQSFKRDASTKPRALAGATRRRGETHVSLTYRTPEVLWYSIT